MTIYKAIEFVRCVSGSLYIAMCLPLTTDPLLFDMTRVVRQMRISTHEYVHRHPYTFFTQGAYDALQLLDEFPLQLSARADKIIPLLIKRRRIHNRG